MISVEHLVEFLRILDGAMTLNKDKVIAYSTLLAEKLSKSGEKRAAKRIKNILENTVYSDIAPSAIAYIGKVPVDSESRISLADEKILRLKDVNVFLEENIFDTVEQFLKHINAADKLVEEGIGISPSMLIYGPPGCGKTELGKYIAAKTNLPLLIARTDGLISSYLGNTAKNIRILFEHAKERPCILFLDEFDALAKLRDDHYELGELKRVVVSLLQNIDALDNNTVVLAATNHEHLLDPAIWRRFAYKVKIEKPSYDVRKKLFTHYIGKYGTNDDVLLLTSISDGATGAEIRQQVEAAKREAILKSKQKIDASKLMCDFLDLHTEENKDKLSLNDRIIRLRILDEKLFTYERLAQIFGISVGKVHNIIKQNEGKRNGKQSKVTNKNS